MLTIIKKTLRVQLLTGDQIQIFLVILFYKMIMKTDDVYYNLSVYEDMINWQINYLFQTDLLFYDLKLI